MSTATAQGQTFKRKTVGNIWLTLPQMALGASYPNPGRQDRNESIAYVNSMVSSFLARCFQSWVPLALAVRPSSRPSQAIETASTLAGIHPSTITVYRIRTCTQRIADMPFTRRDRRALPHVDRWSDIGFPSEWMLEAIGAAPGSNSDVTGTKSGAQALSISTSKKN